MIECHGLNVTSASDRLLALRGQSGGFDKGRRPVRCPPARDSVMQACPATGPGEAIAAGFCPLPAGEILTLRMLHWRAESVEGAGS
jgi:hypothetical protein